MSLGRRAARGARWAFVESLVSAGASVATVVVVARLLSPAEFGLAGLAVAVSAIVQAFLLGGMPDAIVRMRSAHTALTDAAFWAMALIGLGAAAVSGAAGLFVWQGLGDVRLGALTAAQGLTGIALGIAAAPTGLLLRKLRTRTLVQRTIAAKLVALGATVGLALAGWGAWAVVWGNVASQAAAAAALVWTMRRRPRLRRGAPGLRVIGLGETLRLGLLSGTQGALGTLASRGFLLAFGAVFGVAAAGLFNFALRLAEEGCGLVIQTLRRVTVASFAAARRAGQDMAALFVRGTGMIAAVAAPLFIGAAAVAPDAVPLLFGERWAGAVPALQLMLVLWTVRSTRMLVNAVMLVEGRQRMMVMLGVVGLVATAGLFLALAPFGERAATFAYAGTAVGVLAGSRYFARHGGVPVAAQFLAGARPVLLAAAMAGAVALLRAGPLAGWERGGRLAVLIAGGAAVYAGLAWALDRGPLLAVWRALRR